MAILNLFGSQGEIRTRVRGSGFIGMGIAWVVMMGSGEEHGLELDVEGRNGLRAWNAIRGFTHIGFHNLCTIILWDNIYGVVYFSVRVHELYFQISLTCKSFYWIFLRFVTSYIGYVKSSLLTSIFKEKLALDPFLIYCHEPSGSF